MSAAVKITDVMQDTAELGRLYLSTHTDAIDNAWGALPVSDTGTFGTTVATEMLAGQFYGDDGTEAGGVFSVTAAATVPTGSTEITGFTTGDTVIGAFGVDR